MTELITVPTRDRADPGSAPPQRRYAIPRWLAGLLVPVLVLMIWELGVRIEWISDRVLPMPSEVSATIVGMAATGELWSHLLATTRRVLLGFALGASAGTLLGLATGVWRRFDTLFDPTLQALRNIPSIAWAPLFILWFGIFEISKVLMIALGVFFPVYLTLSASIASVDRGLVEVGRSYGFGTPKLVRRILLPASLPSYFIGLRGGLGLGWMFVVAAELLGASEGLGYLLVDGQYSWRPELIIASIALFAVLGKLTDFALASLGRRLTYWQDGFGRAQAQS